MEDERIIELFWERDEDAISETSEKYGGLCSFIAGNILRRSEDCEEVVNDTYLGLWNAIPTKRPRHFPAFIGRITRNLALKKYEYNSAAKRNPDAVCSLEELKDCVSGKNYVEIEVENRRMEEAISRFLWAQDKEKRSVFIRRYWYFESIKGICEHMRCSESRVKSMLYRMRHDLREYLESEGIEV